MSMQPSLKEFRASDEKRDTGQSCRIRRLSDLAPWIVTKKLRTERDFLAAAYQEKNVKEYIINQKDSISNLLCRVWNIEDSASEAKRTKTTRLARLANAAQGPCACKGVTEIAMLEILSHNGIKPSHFATAIVKLLEVGRSRNCNLSCSGPSGCGKSYLVRHLSEIYRTCSLASGSYPLSILMEKDVELFILDDFHYCGRQIGFSLSDALPFFEGKKEITLPLPKNGSKCDALYKNDAPVIITVPARFQCWDLTPDDNDMLNQRFKWIYLTNPIDISSRKDLPVCGSCCARVILRNSSGTG
ncbi:hypothetical protein Pmar_PMAR006595 [Perkinsus marinus ATCC 50983]|uniref:Helicase superfamily 3 single-stranded DNA/RNA virus domain-containing protein n=1 Tax=Perkinsus marinus (strain ATCC 50983 / TXsc) TaxID=423536 RepID=C5LLQ1_PERM5|nr:hypothetical protein Pmar_PMAR006595 [Perkinsus marinus ATCC 50983]EER02273.1 hypothetical protein Pmar_PMAR006595 [Perkinsus marinus ATCC 50983]|eukprot:XP_002769555.1 hypothetical protein Pmar_PMAR006595 [Perkinsus marinus ATCC 50983]